MRREFFSDLSKELQGDWKERDSWAPEAGSEASDMQVVESYYLDQDGKTTEIERLLQQRVDVIEGFGEEVKKKHGRLKPKGFEHDTHAEFT